MTQITRDSLLTGPLPLAEGEVLLASFRADRTAYVRAQLILSVVFGTVAGVVLVVMQNPHPWVGPLAALLAMGARAAFLASEALTAEWRLTDRRVLGPSGQTIPRADLTRAQRLFGDVVLITRNGEKHLMKYMADADAVLDTLGQVTGARSA